MRLLAESRGVHSLTAFKPAVLKTHIPAPLHAPPLITNSLVPAPSSTASAVLTGNTTQLDWMNSKASLCLTAVTAWVNSQVLRVIQETIENILQVQEDIGNLLHSHRAK